MTIHHSGAPTAQGIDRAARKKAAPKAKRTTPRGSLKRKVKKMVRGQSKR